MSQTVIVVGGGIVGTCIAIALQEAGLIVRLIDAGDGSAPTWGNAGHLATEHVEPLASPRTLKMLPRKLFLAGGPLDFVWRDVAAWAPWALRFLPACTPRRFAAASVAMEALTSHAIPAWRRLLGPAADDHLKLDGHWLLWDGPAREKSARAFEGTRTGPARHRPVTPAEAARIAGALGRKVSGRRFSGTGQVAGLTRLMETLRSRFSAAGGDIVHGRVRALYGTRGGFTAALDNGRSVEASRLVVAAGAWSASLLRGLGQRAPLIGERGYHVDFRNDRIPGALSPMVFEDRALVVTRFDHGWRATSIVEFGRPDSPPDPRKWRRIERHLRELGLLEGDPVDRWMGPRPTLPDYLPAIGACARPGLYCAIGHAHLGLTLAALTGELLRDVVTGATPALDLSPFRPGRF